MKPSPSFASKLRVLIGKVPFARDVVALYLAMLDTETPVWAKAHISAALAYFVMPFDAVPDVIVGFGFADDAVAISACLALVHVFVTDKHRQQAERFFAAP